MVLHVDRHRVHREIPAGQVLDDVIAEHDRRPARIRLIRLRPMRRDLIALLGNDTADRAETLTLQPHIVRQIRHQGPDLIRARIRGRIEILPGARPPQKVVPHHATNEEEPKTRRLEALRHRVRPLQHRLELIGVAGHTKTLPGAARPTESDVS